MSRESVQFIEMAREGGSGQCEVDSGQYPEERVILHCTICQRLTVHRVMGWDFCKVIYQCTAPGCVGNRELSR